MAYYNDHALCGMKMSDDRFAAFIFCVALFWIFLAVGLGVFFTSFTVAWLLLACGALFFAIGILTKVID